MLRRLVFAVCVVVTSVCAGNVWGFSLKVDIGDIGQPVKAGWDEFSGDGNNETDPKTEVYDVDGRIISVAIATGVLNDSGYRSYGGGDIGGDMVYPDNSNGSVNGRVFLTLGNLASGQYILTSYHNDTKSDHTQQDPIDVTVGGAVSVSTGDTGVIQTKSLDDTGLGQSTATFTANGTGDVVITYTPTTDAGVVSKAVLNGFELESDSGDNGIVQFEVAESSYAESVNPAVLMVVLLNPPESNTVTVNYAVSGGTAAGGGADYTLNPGVLTFVTGVTSQEIEITIIDDGEDEEDETIEVTLSGAVNASIGSISQHTYTILDMRPTVEFEAGSGEGRENVSPVQIPVSLSWATPDVVTVDYNATGGTAVNGEDYVLSAGTLTFDPCEITKYISVTIIADEYEEDPDETIEITLSNASNAKLDGIVEHTFTILPGMFQICPEGDLDSDCDVDFNDVRIFVGLWLEPSGGCSGVGCPDLDGINGVNMADYARLAGNWLTSRWPVVINELMASNDNTEPDDANEYDDWFELYNGGPYVVPLGGMYLTDNLSNPTKWQIPEGVNINPGEYLLFWADENEGQGPTHTNFKLSASGEEIGLIASDGTTVLDSIRFGDQVTDISYGRYPDASSNLRFFATPTPWTENVGAYLGEVADTEFSHGRGFYDASFLVSVTCDTSGSEIHYTLDGTEPNEFVGGATYLYTAPLAVTGTTTLRAAAFKGGYLPSNADTQTYIFLDDVVIDPSMDAGTVGTYGEAVVKNSLQAIPTLSIALSPDDLANLQNQDSRDDNKEELATSVELIYPDTNDGQGLQMNCAIEGHSWALTKRSFKLIFKTEFGRSQMRYPFFESAPVNSDSAVEMFDRIVLRASKNMPVTYAGDQWTRDSQIEMAGMGARGTYFHLYLNGAYWGIYNATERPDAWFTSSYLGGDNEDYFATNHGIERGEDHISGDSSRFDTMITQALAMNLENPTNYETFKGLCDVTNFADYTILFWFSGFGDNIDNNWYGGMRNGPLIGEVPPEGWMMFMWDAEYVFINGGGPPGNSVPWVPSYYYTMTGYTIPRLWVALHENDDFRMLFADRVYKHCFNGGTLTESNAQGRWNTIVDHISDASIAELARWNKSLPTVVDMSGFVGIFINALRNYSGPFPLYPSIDPPVFNQHGGHVATGFGLTMSNPNGWGAIYYTLDGSDPRQAGTEYGGTITLNESTHVKARIYDGFEWSALNEVTFAVGPVVENVRITEIMYHPEDMNDPNEEFIELQNVGAETVNLNMVKFTNGIDFTFGSVSLSPGEYVVVVQDTAKFLFRHSSFSGVIAGEYTGRLNNAGERIELEDAVGDTILNFRYEDSWREITDGQDYSLTIINPSNGDVNSWSEKEAWRASVYVGGSPGEDDSGILPNPDAIVISEVMSHSNGIAADWIELYNTTGSPIDIGGWFLSDSDSNLTKYEFEAGTTIGIGEYLVVYEDVNFGDTNDPGCHWPFALSENGEKVCLSSGLDGYGKVTGYRSVEDFGASESDVSFGRYYKTSTGNYNFVAMDHNTPGAANAYPKVGPIVINEIMYHPDWPSGSLYNNEEFEYIELYNMSGVDVNLYDEEGNPWKFTDGIDYTFAADANIAAGGYLLIVEDSTAFEWRLASDPAWSVPGGVEICGPYDGKLNNGGEKVELSMPGDIDEFGVRHYIRIDRVGYSDGSHPEDNPGGIDLWAVAADGGGEALARIDVNLYGNDPNNWDASSPSPGNVNP